MQRKYQKVRAIFVWPWNESLRTKQKRQTNGNRAIWTLRWKNFMPENFLEINRYFALTSYYNTIGQSNNVFSILGFSFAGKQRGHVLIFSSIGWWNKKRTLTETFFQGHTKIALCRNPRVTFVSETFFAFYFQKQTNHYTFLGNCPPTPPLSHH